MPAQGLHDSPVHERGLLLDVEDDEELKAVPKHATGAAAVLENPLDGLGQRRTALYPASRVAADDGAVRGPEPQIELDAVDARSERTVDVAQREGRVGPRMKLDDQPGMGKLEDAPTACGITEVGARQGRERAQKN